ncbi:hypothetical protein [Robertkochia aurantiaca]|uniref:hypothetical protein n=1 Tax=Robertkochia aurantiaca TaxID=2873700 RepID=UPI001CCF8403|nr:hypothetical protein [Robertkochia sp. 3YJGBD-33]
MKKLIFLLVNLLFSLPAFAQNSGNTHDKDVASIDAIINAYYDVISGSGTDPWEFERDKFIHSTDAVIIRLDEKGNASYSSLEAEYIPLALSPREDLFEKELGRSVQTYGDIAHVWSAFEIRADPGVPADVRGLNSIRLHFEKGRWFIDSWTVQMETENDSLVSRFLDDH